MAAPTIVSGHVAAFAGGTSFTVNTPTHAAGDVIHIAFAIQASGASLACSGFTALYSNVAIASDATAVLFRKVAGPSEPASYTVTSTLDERATWIAWAVNGDNGIDSQATNASGSSATASVNGITTTVNDCLGIAIIFTNGVGTPLGQMTNLTKLAEISNASATTTGVFYQTIATAGAQASDSVSLVSSRTWIGIRFAIAPVAGGAVLLEVIDEAVDINENAQRRSSLFRQIAEGMALLESILRTRTMARLATDTVDINESPMRLMAMSRLSAETVNINEAAQRLSGLFRAITEAVNITEAAAVSRGFVRVINEALGITEVTNWLLAMTRQIAETVNINEAIHRTRTMARVIDGTLGVTETINRLMAMVRTVGETVNITETIVDVLTDIGQLVIRVINEAVDVAEATNRLMAMTRRVDETLNISESTSRALALVRSVGETVGITEAVNRAATWIRTINETVSITETIRRVRGMSQVIDENITISEATAGIFGIAGKFLRATFKGMYRGLFKGMG